MDGSAASHSELQDVVAKQVLRALREKEQELDEEVGRLSNLNEDDLEQLRLKRMNDMKKRSQQLQELRGLGHGEYQELFEQQDFFSASKASKKLVVHFYRPSTWRCQIVDKHLQELARKHVTVRFVKINAEKAPYLTQKLRILMLPTIMLIKEGKTEHSIIGFDELGGDDDFDTEDLEKVLAKWNIVEK